MKDRSGNQRQRPVQRNTHAEFLCLPALHHLQSRPPGIRQRMSRHGMKLKSTRQQLLVFLLFHQLLFHKLLFRKLFREPKHPSF